MNLRCAIAFPLAALAFSGDAKADQPPALAATKAIIQTVSVTREIAQLASAATILPTAPADAVPAEVAMPVPAASPAPLVGELAAPEAADVAASAKPLNDRLADKSRRHHHDRLTAPDPLCVRPIGKSETGTAAWYGGRYVGRRTTSGSRLDTIHPTAAHRTLPLNSLARVTNLHNGRSVIVRVTDRGPVSASLLIDMSPRAAAELQMQHAGLVPVTVEQVVEVPPDPK